MVPQGESLETKMTMPVRPWQRWRMVAFYAVAMAYAEAAVVAYLRVWLDRVDPYQPIQPLAGPAWLEPAEMLREGATMVMLATVGWLAGYTWRGRAGYFLVAFGIWDTFYYVFLVPLTGWPRALQDWDVLFLIPVPWWGPVWSPVSIAVLMVIGGTILCQAEDRPLLHRPRPFAWTGSGLGTILALYVFMADGLQTVRLGESTLTMARPTEFNWPLFLLAWLLMSMPLWDLASQRLFRSHIDALDSLADPG